MGWVTVYIKGRKGFQDGVVSKLKGAWLLGSSQPDSDLVMFWVPEATNLRTLKVAIGSKLIFKHRLRFFTDLDTHVKFKKPPSNEFSTAEHELVNKMVLRDKHRQKAPDDKEHFFKTNELATKPTSADMIGIQRLSQVVGGFITSVSCAP